MIENWVNWEIWEGVLCPRVVAGLVGVEQARGTSVIHACGTLTRLARHMVRRSWTQYGLSDRSKEPRGARWLQSNVRLYRYYLPACENREHAGAWGDRAYRRRSSTRNCATCCGRSRWLWCREPGDEARSRLPLPGLTRSGSRSSRPKIARWCGSWSRK
jgi:hypothetical protein